MSAIRSRYDGMIHYQDMGEGPPVLLIHGWPLTGDMWEYQTLALLENGYRVIAYDRRGFGQSSHPATGYDYDIFADELADLIDALDLNGVTLVGFSMGGGEVARYLSRYGAAKIARVALISSVLPLLARREDNPDGVDPHLFEDMKTQIHEDRFAFLGMFAQSFYGVGWLSSPVSQKLIDWTFVLAIAASPKATLDCIDAFAHTDFRPDLAAFTVPTLIVHGTADTTVPIGPTARATAAAIPHALLIEYEGEPHGLFATVHRRLNADLLAFINGTGIVAEPERIPEFAMSQY